MAMQPHVAGACHIKLAVPGVVSGALQSLGYSRNLTDVTKEAFWIDVPGDENGGDDGPPIDVIYLGEIARIRLELTKYDDAICDLIRKRCAGAATVGIPHSAGTLMFSSNQAMRLCLHTPTNPRNFPRAFPRSAIEIGRGTKYSSFIVEFEAHKDSSGILYNAATS